MGAEITPDTNPLGMSDEDFLTLNAPPAAPAAGESQGDGKNGQGAGEGEGGDAGAGEGNGEGDDEGKNKQGEEGTTGAGGEGDGGDKGGEGGEGEGEDGKKPAAAAEEKAGDKVGEDGKLPKDKSKEQDPTGKKPADTQTPPNQGKSGEGDGSQGDGKNPPGSKDDKSQQQGTPDYKAFYERIMAPLKANGKTIDLKNPEEAIQLMQMGANYTRKMQALAPHRKLLLMLENNGLLDEGKLSFLIDVEKKNPEAIKKLIKDAGLDPREIDLDDPQAKPYLEGNHRVSDEEAGFRTILDELSSNPEGKATLQAIQTQWDQASKEVLWKQPDVMTLIHQQRESGIYDRIVTELDRQRTLGQLPSNVPFLHAYKAIGDQMAQAGGFDDLVKAPESKPVDAGNKPEPVVTRVQQPKPAATNGDKVNAASPTRSTTARKADTTVNPLALSDDEFMKQVEQFQGRL